jgi:hypothetical protein
VLFLDSGSPFGWVFENNTASTWWFMKVRSSCEAKSQVFGATGKERTIVRKMLKRILPRVLKHVENVENPESGRTEPYPLTTSAC